MLATNTSKNSQYLVFEIANESYCIDINKIKEIRNYSAISSIPNSVSHMLGVISLRGEVVPIFDFKKRFNLDQKKSEKEAFLLIKIANDVIGILVDKIVDILTFSASEMKSPSAMKSALNENFITGIIFNNDKSYIILDSDLIFSQEEIEYSKQAANNSAPKAEKTAQDA